MTDLATQRDERSEERSSLQWPGYISLRSNHDERGNGSGAGGGAGGVKPLRVLVACEFSGTVRDAFSALGHDAWSCDLLPSEKPGQHYQGDVRHLLCEPRQWDLLIAHPPSTHLAVSGARWFAAKRSEQAEALAFVAELLCCRVPRIALENPVSIISSRIRKPDQVIQPWQFGHGETKATCLWLKGLPKLTPTNIVSGREARVHRMPPGPNRWRERSRTFEGIALAMAAQWSGRAEGVGSWFGGEMPTTEAKYNVLLTETPKNQNEV